ASGLIYVLVSFTFFKGVFAKHYRLIALSLLVVFLYGSMIWGTLPLEEGISWEGHMAGLITGLLFALIFRKEIAKPKKYVWEQENFNEEEDPFLKHFDEDGNFIENLNENEEEEKSSQNIINYSYKEQNNIK
ncbi:MAG: rhomboid family intramembrane serine protease, partial [Flavobacteriaceae bacterium]